MSNNQQKNPSKKDNISIAESDYDKKMNSNLSSRTASVSSQTATGNNQMRPLEAMGLGARRPRPDIDPAVLRCISQRRDFRFPLAGSSQRPQERECRHMNVFNTARQPAPPLDMFSFSNAHINFEEVNAWTATFICNLEHINQECWICLKRFVRYDNLSRLKICGHIFHKKCIDQWSWKKINCPLCRIPITPLRNLARQSGGRSDDRS